MRRPYRNWLLLPATVLERVLVGDNGRDISGTLVNAIQVATRPRKGKIPPESAFPNRNLTSLFARDSGHRARKGEAHVP
jgi:hypothetical protein